MRNAFRICCEAWFPPGPGSGRVRMRRTVTHLGLARGVYGSGLRRYAAPRSWRCRGGARQPSGPGSRVKGVPLHALPLRPARLRESRQGRRPPRRRGRRGRGLAMGWDDYDGEYANGADGTCQECGADTDEEWHAYCSACYAAQQGWRPRLDEDDDQDDGMANGIPAPSAYQADERLKVAWLNGFRAGWRESALQRDRDGRRAA